MTLRPLRLAAPLAIAALFASACAKDSSNKDEPKPSGSASATAASSLAARVPDAPEAKPASIPAPADVAAPPADAVTAPSGLASKVLTPGTGKVHPGPTDRVKVHYTGWTTSGEMFDSSVARNEPITFGLNEVI